MAPFKLKFRMGNSREEHDCDHQVNEALLQHQSTVIGASTSTIDSTDCNSLGPISNNERKSLLPNKTNSMRLGYLNHSNLMTSNESTLRASTVPATPPPTYEQSTGITNAFESLHRQLSVEENSQHSRNSPTNHLRNSTNSLDFSLCTDPQCQENFANNDQSIQREVNIAQRNDEEGNSAEECNNGGDEYRKESIDSTELLISNQMSETTTQDNFIDGCTEECCQYDGGACGGSSSSNKNDFCDPLMNHNGYCSNENHYEYNDTQHQTTCDYSEGGCDSDCEDNWNTSQMPNGNNFQLQQQERSLTPEIISNKSSKEIYKDLAKQWGITCKMSDGCRCMECQSHYFDCEFDDNEHQKTDGGLGAGTPMFISEVMHGTACTIL